MGFEIINRLKKEKGLTNAQIAKMSGVTLSTLDKITSGVNTNPKLDTLQAICGVLGCTLNDFMEIHPESKNSPGTDESEPGEEQADTDPLRSTLLHNFYQLNQEGRERLVETSDDMVSSGKYIKSGSFKMGGEKLA